MRVLCFCFVIILIVIFFNNVGKFKQKDVDKMITTYMAGIFVLLYILVQFNHNVA